MASRHRQDRFGEGREILSRGIGGVCPFTVMTP